MDAIRSDGMHCFSMITSQIVAETMSTHKTKPKVVTEGTFSHFYLRIKTGCLYPTINDQLDYIHDQMVELVKLWKEALVAYFRVQSVPLKTGHMNSGHRNTRRMSCSAILFEETVLVLLIG